MPGEVTQVILEDVKSRMDRLEDKLDEIDDIVRAVYRMEAKLDAMGRSSDKDDQGHRDIANRVLRCETQILSVKTEMLNNINEIEKKFLKWMVIAAAASGGAGATILKALSYLG